MNVKKSEKFINSNETLISKKIETDKLAEMLLDTEFFDMSTRMFQSGKFIKTIDQNGKTLIFDSYKSGIRHEPYTNYCERRKIYARFLNNVPSIIDKYPNHKWYSVTLTIKNCHVTEFDKYINFLNASFKRLIVGKKFSRYFHQYGLEYGDGGYFKRIEISKYPSDEMICRPHLHILFHLPKSCSFSQHYISKNTLINLWQSAISNIVDKPSVSIKKIDFKDINEQISNLAEYASYITKHDIDLLINKDFTTEYIKQTHKKNFISKSGTLKHITDKIKNNNDMTIYEDDIKMFKYQYSSSKYKILERA